MALQQHEISLNSIMCRKHSRHNANCCVYGEREFIEIIFVIKLFSVHELIL